MFREFAAGKGPKSIARDLNADGIAGPLGRLWGGTTIRGHVSRGTGIINNELYAGVLVWNRLRYVKTLAPASGCRASIPRINGSGPRCRTCGLSPMICGRA
ncbi:recombinase family protein [Komagataeibacter rhaeticus]|nr:recombinase family protein [Komagataeibacter rhaeticus]